MAKEVKELKLVGTSDRNIIIVNEVIFKFTELQKQYKNQVESFKEDIESLEKEVWFLEVSKKDSPKDEERYNNIRTQKIEASQKAIKSYENATIEAQRLYESVSNFIDSLQDNIHINIEEGVNYAEYDEKFFLPIVDFAINIGWIDYEETIKKEAKKIA